MMDFDPEDDETGLDEIPVADTEEEEEEQE